MKLHFNGFYYFLFHADGKNDIGVVQELQEKKNYSHGNIKDFTRFLQKCTGKEDPTVSDVFIR